MYGTYNSCFILSAWGSWQNVGQCSVSCDGSGFLQRIRACSTGLNADCEAKGGRQWEVLQCDNGPCTTPGGPPGMEQHSLVIVQAKQQLSPGSSKQYTLIHCMHHSGNLNIMCIILGNIAIKRLGNTKSVLLNRPRFISKPFVRA